MREGVRHHVMLLFRVWGMLCILLLSSHSLGREIKLVTGPDYAPYTGETLPFGGIATQIIQEAFEYSGHTASVSFQPWARGFQATSHLEFDGTFPYLINEERLEKMKVSEHFISLRNDVFTRPSVQKALDSAQKLSGMSFCLPDGYAPQDVLAKPLKSGVIRLERSVDVPACLRMMLAKRVDFISLNQTLVYYTLARMGRGAADVKQHVLTGVPEAGLHLMVSRAHPDADYILSEFNMGYVALKSQGRIKELLSF